MQNNGYKTVPFPASRVATFDVGRIGVKKHHIAGLVEVDITEARSEIRKRRRRGEDISFISWFLKTTAAAVEKHPEVHALRRGRRLVISDSVDIAMPVERMVDGKPVPLALLIKRVNEKTTAEICREIEEAKQQTIEGEEDFVLGEKRPSLQMRLFYALPQFLRMLFWRKILSSPQTRKEQMGTVIVTSPMGAGGPSGWALPKSMHNLAVTIGSISRKPWIVKGEVLARDILHLSLLFDHDVVDGAPAARFMKTLNSMLETGPDKPSE